MLVHLIVLRTGQLEEVKAFYEWLGLSFQQEQHGQGPIHFSTQLGETILELYPLDKTQQPTTNLRLGMTVPDLAAVILSLKKHHYDCPPEPKVTSWGKQIVLRDPDERVVEVRETPSDLKMM